MAPAIGKLAPIAHVQWMSGGIGNSVVEWHLNPFHGDGAASFRSINSSLFALRRPSVALHQCAVARRSTLGTRQCMEPCKLHTSQPSAARRSDQQTMRRTTAQRPADAAAQREVLRRARRTHGRGHHDRDRRGKDAATDEPCDARMRCGAVQCGHQANRADEPSRRASAPAAGPGGVAVRRGSGTDEITDTNAHCTYGRGWSLHGLTSVVKTVRFRLRAERAPDRRPHQPIGVNAPCDHCNAHPFVAVVRQSCSHTRLHSL